MADKDFYPSSSDSNDEYEFSRWRIRSERMTNFNPPKTPQIITRQSSQKSSLPSSPEFLTSPSPRVNTPLGHYSDELSPTLSKSFELAKLARKPERKKSANAPKQPYFGQKKRSSHVGFQKGQSKKVATSPIVQRAAAWSPIPVNFPQYKPISLNIPIDTLPKQTVASRKLSYSPVVKLLPPSRSLHSTQVAPTTTTYNFIVNSDTINNMLEEMTVCNQCKRGSVKISQSGVKAGCATYLLVKCYICCHSKAYWSVGGKFQTRLPVGSTTISSRNELLYASILAGRLIGIGHDKMELYHNFLGIPSPCTGRVFAIVQKDVLIAAEYIARRSMSDAVKELRVLHNIPAHQKYLQVIASFDGAYQQRSGKSGGGFSRYCFGSTISVDNGKVLSYGVACNSCKECTEYGNLLRNQLINEEEFDDWNSGHKFVCPAIHSHYASVQLESALAPAVVKSALEIGVVFSGIVTDGDNKTHAALKEERIYHHLGFGDIDRLECLAHAAKRMKINLIKCQEKSLKSMKTEKEIQRRILDTGKRTKAEISKQIDPLFRGKTRKDSRKRFQWQGGPSLPIRTISDAMAAQISSYYKLAVKRNTGNTPAIINAINAIPQHLSATNENADKKHNLCPKGHDSWCRYQSAIANRDYIPSHPNFLSDEAVSVIKKVFCDFGYNTAAFVTKVQEGMTSNHNESLHKVLWSFVLKNETCSYNMMQLGSALAVIKYNDGFAGIGNLLDLMHVPASEQLCNYLKDQDNKRIRYSLRGELEQRKRYAKKQLRSKKTSKQIQRHGQGYSSGRFSAAAPLTDSSSSEEEEIRCNTPLTSLSPEPQLSSTDDVSCPICGGTEGNGIVGIGVGLCMDQDDIDWVLCEDCQSWYHMDCVGVDKDDLTNNEWVCTNCSML